MLPCREESLVSDEDGGRKGMESFIWGAQNATLTFMVGGAGGNPELLTRAKVLLDKMGKVRSITEFIEDWYAITNKRLLS